MEAMAAGLPVVACRIGGIPELVEHGVTGLLVPPDDPNALADAMAQLVANPARASALGAAARTAVAERFSMARMITGFTEILLEQLRRQKLAVGLSAVARNLS
jgi:glycosyltransferase involved in cell wall biosynthesis